MKYQPWLKFLDNTFKTGGWLDTFQQDSAIAITPEQKQQGLNNTNENTMFFPNVGPQVFRGLDNNQLVKIQDEKGKIKILKGPQNQDIFQGNVQEQKMQQGGNTTQEQPNWLEQGEQPISLPNPRQRQYNGRTQKKVDRSTYLPHPAIHKFKEGGESNNWLNNYK